MTESASHAPLRDLLCSMHGSETASLPLTILVGSSLIRGDAVPRARWTSEMCAQIQVMDVGAAEGSGIDEAKTSIIEKIEESAEGAVDDGSVAYLVNAVVPRSSLFQATSSCTSALMPGRCRSIRLRGGRSGTETPRRI